MIRFRPLPQLALFNLLGGMQFQADPNRIFCSLLRVPGILITESVCHAQYPVIPRGNGKLAIVGANGSTEWELDWGPTHDIQVLENEHVLILQGKDKVVKTLSVHRDS